jgi:hypothetical protein
MQKNIKLQYELEMVKKEAFEAEKKREEQY